MVSHSVTPHTQQEVPKLILEIVSFSLGRTDYFKRDLIEATFDQLTKSQHEVLGWIASYR